MSQTIDTASKSVSLNRRAIVRNMLGIRCTACCPHNQLSSAAWRRTVAATILRSAARTWKPIVVG